MTTKWPTLHECRSCGFKDIGQCLVCAGRGKLLFCGEDGEALLLTNGELDWRKCISCKGTGRK